jgi:metal-dependent amidase/aminoacylase/carboxypeptidase family protein
MVSALQTIVSRQMNLIDNLAVVTLGKIEGGVRSNIVPEQVEMLGTIRALDPEDRRLLHERVRRVASGVAEAGATVEIQLPYTMAYPVTYDDVALTEEMLPVLRAVAGDDSVHLRRPETGVEDFSFIAEKVPGIYIDLGGRPSQVPEAEAPDHHTAEFHVDDSGLGLSVLKERKASAAALARSERRFKQLFDRSPDPIFLLDGLVFSDCNQAAVELMATPAGRGSSGATRRNCPPSSRPAGPTRTPAPTRS